MHFSACSMTVVRRWPVKECESCVEFELRSLAYAAWTSNLLQLEVSFLERCVAIR